MYPGAQGGLKVFGQWPADPFCRFGSVRFLRTDRGGDRPAALCPGFGKVIVPGHRTQGRDGHVAGP